MVEPIPKVSLAKLNSSFQAARLIWTTGVSSAKLPRLCLGNREAGRIADIPQGAARGEIASAEGLGIPWNAVAERSHARFARLQLGFVPAHGGRFCRRHRRLDAEHPFAARRARDGTEPQVPLDRKEPGPPLIDSRRRQIATR